MVTSLHLRFLSFNLAELNYFFVSFVTFFPFVVFVVSFSASTFSQSFDFSTFVGGTFPEKKQTGLQPVSCKKTRQVYSLFPEKNKTGLQPVSRPVDYWKQDRFTACFKTCGLLETRQVYSLCQDLWNVGNKKGLQPVSRPVEHRVQDRFTACVKTCGT